MADRPYLALLSALTKAQVRHAVAGGLAVVLHGVPRMTFDLDLVIAPGVTWDEVQATLVKRSINGGQVSVIGKALLRRMKLASGRPKDRADAELLGD